MTEQPEETEPDTVSDDAPEVHEVPIVSEAESADESNEEDVAEELDPLQQAQKLATEWKDRAMRTQAEMENYRKRSAREKSEAIRYANGNLMSELLPILDNFEMGLQAANQEDANSIIVQGMNMVFKQMQDFFENNNVKEVDAAGRPFDPNQHDAISQDHNDDVPEGTIIKVIRRGYRLHDRLLRAANVVVSKGPATNEGAGSAEDESAPEAAETN